MIDPSADRERILRQREERLLKDLHRDEAEVELLRLHFEAVADRLRRHNEARGNWPGQRMLRQLREWVIGRTRQDREIVEDLRQRYEEAARSLQVDRTVVGWLRREIERGWLEELNDGQSIDELRLVHGEEAAWRYYELIAGSGAARPRSRPFAYAPRERAGNLSVPRTASRPVGRVPVSIYLTENAIHEKVEKAVVQWLATADVSILTRDEPITGSWFRRMEAGIKKAVGTPAGQDAVLTAKHIADSRLVQTQDAYVTATLLQNVGPVLHALQPTKDAIVRAGALLIVKVDWVVQVHQLTAAQQAILDHRSHLVASPKDIIAALQLSEPTTHETGLPSAAEQTGYGEAASAAD